MSDLPEASATRGKAARTTVPRSSHGRWEPSPDRAGPMAVLRGQERTRVPELLPIRHGRMVRSPFTFFRGAAAIMAADLAGSPDSGIRVQLCGDAHLANFGVFAAPDRRLVFDLNDFDETLPGPWEWDVKRLAASIAVAGRDRGFGRSDRSDAILAAVRAYRETMRGFAAMRSVDVWYARLDEQRVAEWPRHLSRPRGRRLEKGLAKARRKDSLRAMAKLTVDVDGSPRIRSDPPLIVPLEELLTGLDAPRVRERLGEYLHAYQETLQNDRRHLLEGYSAVDIAHKVVGVGSVGTRAWIVLFLGRDAADPLFLQLKEAGPSVLAPYVGPGRAMHQGRRVVEGQRLMQAAGDEFLGWLRVQGDLDGHRRDYYVRQLWDGKWSAPVETMSPTGLAAYAGTCGWTLARAHARSGDRIAIAAYLGAGEAFDRALATFAEAYADQNERDHAALAAAIERGDVEADLER